MIAKMLRVHVVSRVGDRDRLLEALRQLGVVHLEPVDRQRASPRTETVQALDHLRRALQVLATVEPSGTAAAPDAVAAAEEVMKLQREAAEARARLTALYRTLNELALWGDARLEQFRALKDAGVDLEFFWAAPGAQFQADHVQALGVARNKRTLTAVVNRDRQAALGEDVEAVPLPSTDRPAVRAEAAEIDRKLKADGERLAVLANVRGAMEREIRRLEGVAAYTVARRSGLIDQGLYAVQGWVPADQAEALSAGLEAANVQAGVQTREPAGDEEPPTLIRYPRWARPIKGLFDILGTVPGYREFDVSAMFMIALPIFAAMLISDAGYGLVFLLLPVFLYRKIVAKMGPELAYLTMVIGMTSLVWGVVTASFFGFDPRALAGGGFLGRIGQAFQRLHLLSVNMQPDSQHLLMRISFTLGLIQLSAAHLIRARTNFPHLRFLGNVGWAVLLFGMYGLVKMFVLKDPFVGTIYPYALALGGVMAIVLADPQRNMLKAIALGLANFPLSFIGTFGDTVSYVRLMAIGLAGSALAMAFNDLGFRTGSWFAIVPILIVGHALNIALSIVSLFAHGVRLNMLEFSNNLGMQWSGYPYAPFAKKTNSEET